MLTIAKQITQSVQGNMKHDLFVRPKPARTVHKKDGFAFLGTDRVTQVFLISENTLKSFK